MISREFSDIDLWTKSFKKLRQLEHYTYCFYKILYLFSFKLCLYFNFEMYGPGYWHFPAKLKTFDMFVIDIFMHLHCLFERYICRLSPGSTAIYFIGISLTNLLCMSNIFKEISVIIFKKELGGNVKTLLGK